MKLTGKCKEDFEKWLDENYKYYDFYNVMGWYEHIPSMQYGVYEDFFDSVGISVDVMLDPFDGLVYWYSIQSNQISYGEPNNDYPTRAEARQKAIEKANEIYNENKNIS